MTRHEILSKATDDCLKELYKFVVPHVEWEDFKKECEVYSKKYYEWDNLPSPRLDIKEYCGPKPYEFYYLPKEIMKSIVDSYIHSYRIDQKQEFLDSIETLKNYCKEPVVDKYIDDWTDETGFHHPGYRSYDHPDNLVNQLTDLIPDSGFDKSAVAESVQSKFFEFLDMAGKFFDWNGELNSFNMTVYLGPSPNSNKETVINNWKQYRNQDIEIDEEKIKKEYYGDEELD